MERRDDRLRADQRPGGAGPDGQQDRIGEHRRGLAGGERRRSTRSWPTATADLEILRRLRPGRLHHRVARRAAARGRPGGALRRSSRSSPSSEPALDVRGRDEHPALAARRAGPDAGHRDHDEHHDPRAAWRSPSVASSTTRSSCSRTSIATGQWARIAARPCSSGTSEVAGAITWSTLTTVAVFLPLGFAGGPDQPVLPALRADGELRAARLAGRGTDRRAGPRLVLRRQAAAATVDAEGEPKRSIWVRLYDPTIRAGPPQPMDGRWRPSSARCCCSSARCSSCRCCRPRSSTPGSEKILVVSVFAASGRELGGGHRDRAVEAEAIMLADDEVELVQTSVPPEGDTGFRTLISAQAGRAANSATIFVRLDQESDLDAAAVRLEESLGADRDRWLGRGRPAEHRPVRRWQPRARRGRRPISRRSRRAPQAVIDRNRATSMGSRT